MKLIKTINLIAPLAIASGLLLAVSTIYADPQDDAAFTCASAVNVMDCIQKTGTGTPAPKAADITAVPVSTQALGFSGPITAGIRYDNYLAWILDVGYSQQFYNAAAAFKLSAGLNERRANVTLGYSITPKQQIKLTYEYLSQNLPFDYASGTVNEWVSQNALGGAYRYILDNGIVRALDVYGTYTKASSKNLSNVEMYTDDVLTAINYRRIAGGTEMTAGTNITLTPFKNTIIKLGGGYSTLSFDTQWEDSAATAAIAYNAELSHLLTPTTLISTGIGNTASGTTYTTKISQILPWSLEASLMGQYTATTNDIPGSSSVTAQLSYPAPKTYTNMFADGIGKLKDWVEKPVLYQTRVLAKAEERVVAVQITTTPIPPATVAVGTDLTPPIQTKDYFSFNTETLDKVNYIIASITPKNDTQITYAPNDLGLQIVPVDTYNAELSSASIMPSTALNPGIYTVTLQASGYRSGSVVSQVNNPVDITVATNPNLAAPTWIPNAQLPATAANANNYSADLRSLVKNNTGLADETYTFALSNNPSWLTLGGTDNQFLVLASGATVPANVNSASVDLNATSNTSDNKTGVQKFTIKISGTPTGPVWAQDPNVVSIKYPQTAPTKIFVVSSQYVTTIGTVTANNFSLKNNLPSNAIQNMTTDASGTYVTVNPPALNDIGNTGSFSLTATDSNGQSTGNFTVPIIASSATDLTLPNWITLNPPSIPNATVGVKYESNNTVILNPYSSPATVYLTKTTTKTTPPTEVDDQLTFAKNDSGKSDACTWMLIDSNTGQLTGTPPQSQNCNLYVNVTSKAAGTTYALDYKVITVVGATPTWSTDLTGSIPYNPVTYNASKPFAFYIVPSTYIGGTPTISNIQIPQNFQSNAIQQKIILDDPNKGNAYVPIDPSNIGDVYADDNPVTGQFSVDATVAGSAPATGLFTIKIIPNPNFIPAQENMSAQLPDVNYDGTPYPVTINPYKRSTTNPDNKAADYYISFTKSSSDSSAVTVPDVLTFVPVTDATSCQWAQITADGVIQQKSAVTGSNCTIQAKIMSRATGKTVDYKANIIINIAFQPYFVAGQPQNAFYATQTYILDLSQVIVSNRAGDQISSTFETGSPWSCTWLSLQSDGKTLQGVAPAPQVPTGNGITTCVFTVKVTSASVGDSYWLSGTVTIKPDTTIPFAPTGTLGNAMYGVSAGGYDQDLTTLVKSNRPGEPLTVPFTINNSNCTNLNGTSWLAPIDSNNHLKNALAVPVKSGVTSCTVTLNVRSAYNTDVATTPLTITFNQNPSMAPAWDPVACPLTNNMLQVSAYSNNTSKSYDLSKCVKNYYPEGVQVEDNSLSFSGSPSGTFVAVNNTQLVATPTSNNVSQTLSYTLNTSSQAYSKNGSSKPVSVEFWVPNYYITSVTQQLPTYNFAPLGTYYSTYVTFQMPKGVRYTLTSPIPSAMLAFFCPKPGTENQANSGIISHTAQWNPFSIPSNCTQWTSTVNTFMTDPNNNATLVFTQLGSAYPVVTNVEISVVGP